MNIKLRNRLEVLMKDSGVKSFEEMAQRLRERQGIAITRTSVSRKFRDEDVALPLSLIQAICNELQCLPADLFETDVSEVSDAFVADLRSRVQPFRYGTLRTGRPAEPSARPKTPVPTPSEEPAPLKAADAAVDLDAVLGPRVRHLHVDKLNKKP
jgi:DNA-binding Xre family transcriptional regulator